MKKNKKLLDIIGASCGMFLVAVLIISIISNAVASAPPKGAVTLTGSAPGRNGDVAVEVVTDGSTIASLAVTAHEETEGIGTMAVDQLPAAIVAENSLAVDNISGASITSEAIKAAAAKALTEGGFDAASFGYVVVAEEPAEPTPEPVVETAADGKVTTTGSYNGIDGPVVVEVTADATNIFEVKVVEQNETVGIGSVAVEKLPAAIVAANSLLVDDITGATVTSTAIKNGVREALGKAGFDVEYFETEHAADQAAPAEEEAAPAEAAEPVTLEADVVVIGAGGAGMSAAITASDAGMDVIIVESQPMVGGNSVRSTGGMNAAPTEWREMNSFGESAGVESTLAKVEKYPDNARIQELGAIVAEQWAEY